jgi:ribosomal protein L37E
MSNIFEIGGFSLNLSTISLVDLGKLEEALKKERAVRLPLMELDLTERCLVKCGQHIPAIKAYRNRTLAGLRQSKDACDAYRKTLPGYQDGAVYDEATNGWTLKPVDTKPSAHLTPHPFKQFAPGSDNYCVTCGYHKNNEIHRNPDLDLVKTANPLNIAQHEFLEDRWDINTLDCMTCGYPRNSDIHGNFTRPAKYAVKHYFEPGNNGLCLNCAKVCVSSAHYTVCAGFEPLPGYDHCNICGYTQSFHVLLKSDDYNPSYP